MKIALTVGHSEKVRGMRGSPVPPECDEVDECFKICTDVSKLLESQGVECPMFFDTTSTSQSQYLSNINNWVNNQPNTDLAVSCHLNAGGGDGPVGCEVWYYTQKTMAAKIATAMANALDLPDRGPKYSSSLSFLVNTNPPAVLLECFFGDSRTDCEAYAGAYAALVEAIAESMAGIEIDDSPPEPVEPPEPTPPSDDNRVDIVGSAQGDVQVIINGTVIYGSPRCRNVVRMRMTMTGDVVVSLNGEEFHNKPTEPEEPDHPPPLEVIQSNHKDIEATIFGGAADNEHSAYPPYDSNGNGQYLNDSDFYVSLPVSIKNYDPDNPPLVRVFKGELSGVGPVLDKGPWVINDDNYVYGNERPIAETCYLEHSPLPAGSGNNAGKVPSNKAGIDLSPALAGQIGVDGKGIVSWCWESETDTA